MLMIFPRYVLIQRIVQTRLLKRLFICFIGFDVTFKHHITTVPACSRGILTNVLSHRNSMPQTQDMTPHPVTVYRHEADLSLCYPMMWNVTLEYTATNFKSFPDIRHTLANTQLDAVMVVIIRKLGRKHRTNRA